MESRHLLYERFAEKIIDSFHEFLCELEKSNSSTMDPFMNKLHDIDKILQKLFEKANSPLPSIQQAKQSSTRDKTIPAKIKIDRENISTSGDKKRKSPDGGYPHRNQSDDIFERMKMYISRDVDGSDDSDCEMKSVPVRSEDLFKSDYPDECFMSEEKQENEVSYQDVSSSFHKSSVNSIEDDPYIRILNSHKPISETSGASNDQNSSHKPISETSGAINDPNSAYPYIIKVTDDVFKCQLCSINNLPQNNLTTHVGGRQHKNALSRQEGIDLKLKETVESLKAISKPKDVSLPVIPMYECTLCKTEITCRENALQHVNGRQHNRKLEIARANA